MTRGIVVLALVVAVTVTTDARANTSFQVTREGQIPELSTDQPASYAQMQFNDWNTQLPGDTGDQGLTTAVMSSANLRFHEENVWLPGDTDGLGLLSRDLRTETGVSSF
jgi:hypothetical protein